MLLERDNHTRTIACSVPAQDIAVLFRQPRALRRTDRLRFVWAAVLASQILDEFEKSRIPARPIQRSVKGAVELLDEARLALDLNSRLQMLRRQNVPLGSMRNGKDTCFALDEQAHPRKIAYGFRREPHNFHAPIRPDSHQTRCPEILQRQADRLPAQPKAFCERVLVQDGAREKPPETNILSELIGNRARGAWIHGSNLGLGTRYVKTAGGAFIGSHGRCFTSGKQIAAAEIVNGEHDALKVIPPDPSRGIVEGLCDGSCHRSEH
jgi:hypothetical protein